MFSVNDRVRHISNHDWGIGKVIEVLQRDTLKVYFTECGIKKIKQNFIEIVSISAPLLDDPGLVEIDDSGFFRNGIHSETRNIFDNNGYDKNGLDENGLDVCGFDRNGKHFETGTIYNTEGFDKLGFTCDGFDKYGFNKKGFDKNGFNIKGYNKDGFNRKGVDAEGFDKNGNRQLNTGIMMYPTNS